ncbi:PTS sugar transporter subunit IIA [Heyndrickxia acidiproducens]|jgi:PTS system glucose-specific IIA component|uniref:PTS sugar transporter subunit IIA n=1 Tax=Heyndrickxia acidiproducens TaxID=1121084 RepID=UPI00037F8EB3|nr:PTS glucose transporter subunit IIA [Heyndrickxia acidiproducens]
MFKLFAKKAAVDELVSPITGKVVKIEDVPDEMFSQKMIGDGIAIEPEEGVVAAPIDGEIVQLFPTMHAVGIRGKSGIEILIHIGLETVTMNGEGFQGFVKQGDSVKAGDKLITFDLESIKKHADSIISPVVITNPDSVNSLAKTGETYVKRGESVLLTVKMH